MTKINISKTQELNEIRRAGADRSGQISNKKAGPVDTKLQIGADKLEFSSRAAAIGELIIEVKQFPDTRNELVSSFGERIASGKYQPSAPEIAGAIIRDEAPF